MRVVSNKFGCFLIWPVVAGMVALMITGITLAQVDAPPAEEGSAESTEAATGQPISEEQLQQMLEEGQKALDAGEFEKALTIFDQLVRAAESGTATQELLAFLTPNVLDLYTSRARALVGLKDYAAAIEDFKKVTDSGRDYVPALVARGQMYLDAGAASDALLDFEKAVKADRANIKAQFGLGKAYALLGGAQQAIGPLTRVLAAEPQNEEAFRLRGSAYAGIGDSIKAKADLQEALNLNPKDFEAYFTLGTVYLREEDYQEAVSQFDLAIQNFVPPPGLEGQPLAQAHLTKAVTLIELGKTAKEEQAKKAAYQAAADECELLFKQLDEKSPSTAGPRAATLFSLGIAQRLLGELDKAIASLSAAIAINPELGEAVFRRGICFHLVGEDKMAISDFKHAANIMFDDPRASLWEGFLYSKIGDYHEAIRAFGNALAASDRYTPAYVNRGLAYMMLGKYQQAIDDFNEAIRLEPTQSSHYFKRGVAYAELGDNEKASNSFASAIAHNDKHAPSYRRMAQTMEAMGHADLAREYRQKADALVPPNTSAQPQ
jgi:tetratricopeptide (TPR) repeat protein